MGRRVAGLAAGDEVDTLLEDQGAGLSKNTQTPRRLPVLALVCASLAAAAAVASWAKPSGASVRGKLFVQGKFEVPREVKDEPHFTKLGSVNIMGHGEEGCSGEDPSSCDHMMEGDLLLNPDQKAAFENKTMVLRVKTNGYLPHGGKISLWPQGKVKYAWDANVDGATRDALKKAMKEWEAKTCIEFEEVASRGGGAVTFKSSGRGCNAHIGYSSHWEHDVNLEAGTTCSKLGVALHELGHTIGLRHEHARPEAAEHIEYQPQNTDDWWQQWLTPRHDMGDISAGVPYDMSSIMHYGPTGGSKNGKDTLVVKEDDVFGNCRMGQRAFLSAGDIVTINRWYGCPNTFCADLHQHCADWAKEGACSNNPGWMEPNCPHSCGKCVCEDTHEHKENCPGWAAAGYCHRGHEGTPQNKAFMRAHCSFSCGNCHLVDASLCKDQPIWGSDTGCADHKVDQSVGDQDPDCWHPWVSARCPKTCGVCPHDIFCW